MTDQRNIRPPYFTKTVLTFLAPLILSIVILGFFSVKNSQSFVLENVHRVNSNILRQTRDTMDSIMDELNIITLNFSINTKVQYALRRILQKDLLDYDDIKELEIIQNMLSISHYSRTYIQSIYVYFNNPRERFITSELVRTSLDAFPDKGWHKSYLEAPQNKNSWWEERRIRRIGMSVDEVSVLTFYKMIYNSTSRSYNGVVVFNVYSDYIRESLAALETFENQTIFILDEAGNFISRNNNRHDFLLPELLALSPGVLELQKGGRRYTVGQIRSKYDLQYLSLVPNDTLYKLPNYLFKLNLLYILVSLFVGICLSLYFAHNSNKQIRTIIDIIGSAKQGRLHAPEMLTKKIQNSYQYILYNIINTFIEKDYLTIQLSEKMYKSRLDELIALQSQINPHFLFNTLQTINMKAMSLGKGKNDVSYMIEHLSLILRYSLSDPAGLVRLEEEISHAKSYLAIQSIRYRDKIRVRWDYDSSVLGLGTIKLLFQPLLENSIYHGIKEREDSGEIAVTVDSASDNLTIVVSDTGVGIPPERLREVREKLKASDEQFEHIGLYNTNRRIKLTFGEAYGISVDSEAGRGTTVRITLPKISL